jgi:hypothetical protein
MKNTFQLNEYEIFHDITPKTLLEELILQGKSRFNFGEVFTIIKFEAELREFLEREGLDYARPCLANWTGSNDAYLHILYMSTATSTG